jgi:hypothetical protein
MKKYINVTLPVTEGEYVLLISSLDDVPLFVKAQATKILTVRDSKIKVLKTNEED